MKNDVELDFTTEDTIHVKVRDKSVFARISGARGPHGSISGDDAFKLYPDNVDALSRTVRARFDDIGIQLAEYVPPGGTAGLGDLVQTALDDAAAAGAPLLLGPGTRVADWSASLGHGGPSTTFIKGAGPGLSTFTVPLSSSPPARVFYWQNNGPTGYLWLDGFDVDASAMADETGGAVMQFEGVQNLTISGVRLLGVSHSGFRLSGAVRNALLFRTESRDCWGHGIELSGSGGLGAGIGPHSKDVTVIGHTSWQNKGAGINAAGAERTIVMGSRFMRDLANGYLDAYSNDRTGNNESFDLHVGCQMYGGFRNLRITDGNHSIYANLILQKAGGSNVLVNLKDGNGNPIILTGIQAVDSFRNVGWATPTIDDDADETTDPNDSVAVHIVACDGLIASNINIACDVKQPGLGLITTTAGSAAFSVRQDEQVGGDFNTLNRRGVVPYFIFNNDDETLVGQYVTFGAITYYNSADVALNPADFGTHKDLVQAASYSITTGSFDGPALQTLISALWTFLQPDEMTYTETGSALIDVRTDSGVAVFAGIDATAFDAHDVFMKFDHTVLGVAGADGTDAAHVTLTANGLFTYSGLFRWLRPKKTDIGLLVRETASRVSIDWRTLKIEGPRLTRAQCNLAGMELSDVPSFSRAVVQGSINAGQSKRFNLSRPLKNGQWRSHIAAASIAFSSGAVGTGAINYASIALRVVHIDGTESVLADMPINQNAVSAGQTIDLPITLPPANNDLLEPGALLVCNIVGHGSGAISVPDLDVTVRELPW